MNSKQLREQRAALIGADGRSRMPLHKQKVAR
jgi:hypothetical protein